MKAIRVHAFGGPEVLRFEEVPDPEPGPGQVLVRLKAAGVNPVDVYIRSGQYARLPSLPYIPGSDGAGEVAAVGSGVLRFRGGERVYVVGVPTYAQWVAAPEENVWPLPERLSFEQGAALGIPYVTAYRAIHWVGRARPGDWVLVHGGSGGVGTAAIQIALAHGLQIVATAGSEAGKALAAAQGAHHVLGHDQLEEARELTGGRGFDLILEMLANVNLGRDLPALASGGRVVVIGSRGSVEINPRDLMGRDASIIGMSVFNAPRDELRRIHMALGAGLRNGALTPVVGRRFPLAEAAKAHEAVMAPGAAGKVVLVTEP